MIQCYANNVVFDLKIKLLSYKIAMNYLLSPFFLLFIHPFKIDFFLFFCFLIYILNILHAIENENLRTRRLYI